MFLLDSLLIGGLRFVLDKVATVVDQELDNPEHLQQRLLEAQMDLEEGRLDAAAFAEIEADVLARMRELRSNQQIGGIADADSFEDIEIEVDDGSQR
jgi:Gas vesicle protein G